MTVTGSGGTGSGVTGGGTAAAVNGSNARSDARERTPGPRAVHAQEVCRLTVLARSTQVDMALPIDVPLSLLIPGVVDMIARSSSGGETVGEGGASTAWTLSRIGYPPLSPTSTLAEMSVQDGELLVLGVAHNPAPMPLFDDLMSSVAGAGADEVPQWTPATARIVGSVVAAASVAIGCAILLAEPLRAGADNAGNPVHGLVAFTAALLFAVSGLILDRIHRQNGLGTLLGGCALPLAFTGGVLIVPGSLGAPAALLGATAVGALAITLLRIGGGGVALFTATGVLAACTVAASVCVLFTSMTHTAVATAATLVGLLGIALSARVSMTAARLPLPPVPTAGAPLDTPEEVELDAVSFDDLEEAAARARNYLTGLISAFSVVVVAGARAAAMGANESGTYRPGAALAVLCSLVLLLRGRTYAVVTHAVPLVGGGTVIVIALLIGAASSAPASALAWFAVTLAFAAAALVFGALLPTRTFSPVMRRSAELAEYACIALVVPVAVWVGGLYSVMRGL